MSVKIVLTKSWQEMPYQMLTLSLPAGILLRFGTGATAPTTNGISEFGPSISKYSADKLWCKLDASCVQDSVEAEGANFI